MEHVSVHNSYMRLYEYMVITGDCGKVTYYISGSITRTFLKLLYLDYHS